MQAIQSGDVVEFDGPEGPTSALVLLAHDDALILDLLDDSTPVSVLANELTGPARVRARVVRRRRLELHGSSGPGEPGSRIDASSRGTATSSWS